MDQRRIIFVVGPTGVGKTEISFHLARRLNAQIISGDAMQVYKEVSIVSGKPPEAILKKIPHHLIGIVSITEEFDVMNFHQRAKAVLQRVLTQNQIPIVVGGSGLYVQVLLDGLFMGVPQDIRLRGQLEAVAEEQGNDFLFGQLTQWDPTSAQRIHPHDRKRMIRALEVFLKTRRPISVWQAKREGLWGKFDIHIFGLNKERDKLYQAIDQRVEGMVQHGAVGEIERLKDAPWSRTARKIIGVEEIFGFLKREYPLEKAKDLMKFHTHQYAKRQLTWFRREKRLHWIMIGSREASEAVASRITERLTRNE